MTKLPDGRTLARQLPCAVTDTIARLEDYGHQAVVVGGAVRSLLLGRQPTDWDIATSATPAEVARLFSRVHLTGAKYGTVTVIEGGVPLEVTTFRADGVYTDGRRPDTVEFGTSLVQDLARRDFTINAIALDLRGQLIDPHGGQADLARRVVRAVGQPVRRFREDALRLLRAIRLAAELQFRLAPATGAAVKAEAAALARVAAERRLQELQRLLLAPAAQWGLSQLRQTGLWPYIWPGNPLPRAAPQAVAKLPHDWTLRLAACCVAGRRAVPAGAKRGLRELRLPRRALRRLQAIVTAWPPAWPDDREQLIASVVRTGRRLSEDLVWLVAAGGAGPAVERVQAVRDLLNADSPLDSSELAVTGGDLLQIGFEPGPAVGKALQQLLQRAAAGEVANDRPALLAVARTLQEFPALAAKRTRVLPQ